MILKMMKKPPLLEVCAQSLTSALIAQQGGADRIELCAALELGGITPSASTINAALQKLHIPICVLIRPRAGDFCYTDAEYETMKSDIIHCKNARVAGVVVGALLPDATFDWEKMKGFAQVAAPMPVICHRAFDYVKNPLEALEMLIQLGYQRVLTSGTERDVWKGKETLKNWVEKAQNRIEIMPGGGITTENLPILMQEIGATSFHFSAKKHIKSPFLTAENMDYWETDLETVQKTVAILRSDF